MRPPAVSTPFRSLGGPALVAIAATVLVGGFVRTLGIRFGAPFTYHIDEWLMVGPAMGMVRTGDWNPHVFLYPSLLIEMEAVLVAIRHAIDGTTLVTSQPWLHETELLPQQFGYVWPGRVLVMAMGTATILVVFEATRRLTSTGAGLATAAVLALMPLHVQHAHYLTTDVPVAFFCALTLLVSLRASTSGRDRWWLAAGVVAGLAGSTKWNGLAVVGVPLLAWLATTGDLRRPGELVRAHAPWLVGVGALGALLVTTPALVLDATGVIDDLRVQAATYALARPEAPGSTIVFHASALVSGVGPMLIAAVTGLVVLALGSTRSETRRVAMVVPTFVVAYFVLASLPPRHYERNLMPILPFLAVAAGVAIGATWSWLLGIFRARRPPEGRSSVRATWLPVIAISAVLVACLLPAAIASVGFAQRLARPDTRDVALAWMLEHIPRGTRIVRELGTPQTTPEQFDFRGSYFLWQHDLAYYRGQGVHYLITSSAVSNRFLTDAPDLAVAAFYVSLDGLPQVFRVDPDPDRTGPTIRIFELRPGAATPGGQGVADETPDGPFGPSRTLRFVPDERRSRIELR